MGCLRLEWCKPEGTTRGTIKVRRCRQLLDPLSRLRPPPNRHLPPTDPLTAPFGQVLAYTDAESVSLNVGLYYMANAAGRLLGTLLSGALFLWGGMQACLWMLCLLVALAFGVSRQLPAIRNTPD